MNVERICTGVVLFASLAAIFWIVPLQVEEVDYGRVFPSTVPLAALWIIAICAGFQLFLKATAIPLSPYVIVRTLCFFAAIVTAVISMNKFGFEYCGPPLALGVMLLIGERRWHWLANGSLVIPFGVWLLVEQVLGRQLP